jgi:class 3 adenylate cyclase
MRINIQTKLFILMSGLTALIVFGVLLVINKTFSTKIEQKVIGDFNKTKAFFSRQQSLIYDRLVESCYLIGENSTFKANVELQDPGTVYFSVQEFSNFANVDLFIVTDKNGRVLARLGNPGKFGEDLTFRPGIARALSGLEPDAESTWGELWELEQNLYQVATVPLYYSDRMIGTISLGTMITRYEAEQLKGESKVDISLFYRDWVLGTTLSDSLDITQRLVLQEFVKEKQPLVDAVVNSLESSPAFTMWFNNQETYAFLSPLGKGEPAFYLATVPKAAELQILDVVQANILRTAGIGLLVTIILALLLGRTFSRPILKLVESMNKVKEGDLQVTLNPTTQDEIGLLTQTFNGMIIGLRERLHLMRYVGSHTIDMIRKVSNTEVRLGGDRKNLAVLFSDIRGFTSYSENRSPEEVISMLNTFLGLQAETVALYGGSVDKFVGDEMVALFGGEKSVENALECAVAIQKMMRREKEKNPHSVQVGIGINYGSMILGNMGAKERMDYTVIGSAVNLAARLCSAAGAEQILIPQEILRSMKKEYKTCNTQSMLFKGFSEKIQVVEVFCEN